MKIVVADDEFYARFTIIDMLMQMGVEKEQIYEVEDGNQLIEVMQKYEPHIVFTDIKMPIKEGIEVLQEARDVGNKSVWIVLSGYGEFAYAQKAIKLGAYDYLTKPISYSTLFHAYHGAKDKIKSEFYQKNLEWGQSIMISLSGFEIAWEYDFSVQLKIFAGGYGEKYKSNWNVIVENIRALEEEFILKEVKMCLVLLSEGQQALAIGVNKDTTEEAEKILEEVELKLQHILQDDQTTGILIFQTECTSDMQVLIDQINLFHEIQDISMVLENDKSHSILKLQQKKSEESTIFEVCEYINKLIYERNVGNYVAYRLVMDKLMDFYKKRTIYINQIMLQNIVDYIEKTALGSEFLTSLDGEKIKTIQQLMEGLNKIQWNDKKKEKKDIIEEIKLYVKENYHKDISVGKLADEYELTPNYLSALFKNSAGTSFVNYVTDIRIEKAKELLLLEEFTVSKIATQVGYINGQYLSRVFKEKTGETTQHYVKRVKEIRQS